MEANAKSPIKKPSVRSSSLTDAGINFFEKGNTDMCELRQNTWAPLPQPLVVDSGAGETVMPVDWLTSHPLTKSDGSRAHDSKVYNEGQRKLDVCTLDGQQRRSMIRIFTDRVVPELCVSDLLERVAEVEMSSSNPVRVIRCLIGCNRLTKIWSMRKNRELSVWKYTRIHRMMTKKKRELLHKEKELDHYLNPGFPVGRRFRNTN